MSQKTAQESDDASIAQSVINELEFATELLESLETHDVGGFADSDLVELHSALRDLEKQAETARKDEAEPVLEDRVEPGDSLLGLSHVESHRKFVLDDAGTVIGRAAQQGINYTEFVDLDAVTLANDFPDLAEIGKNEYTYFR